MKMKKRKEIKARIKGKNLNDWLGDTNHRIIYYKVR